MLGLVLIVVIAATIAVAMHVLADMIEAGRTEPNMAHHTAQNTTPESWAAMKVAVIRMLRRQVRWYVAALMLAVAIAAFSGSAEAGTGAGAIMLALSAVVVLVEVFRAATMLEPLR